MAAWLENEAKRTTRNLLLVNLTIAGAVIALAALNSQYCLNFVLGCQRIDAFELSSLKSSQERKRNFVTVTGAKSAKSGYQDIVNHVEKSSGRVLSTDVSDEYVFLKVGDRILPVKADPGAEKLEYSGELVPTTETVQRDLITPFTAEEPELGKMLLPFTLNAADYRGRGYWGFGIGIPLLLLASWNCLRALRRQGEVQTSPVWKQMAAYGDVEQLSQSLEMEEKSAHPRYGGLHLTNSWLFKRKIFSTWACPLNDLAWVYQKVTKHSVNFIPTGKSYAVILVGRHRQQMEESMKQAAALEFMQTLAARVPWAIYGFSKEIEAAWRKDPAAFVGVVDSRRQQQGQAKTATASTPA